MGELRLHLEDEMTKFLIWSIEHGAWWAPARSGYTVNIREAGRYTWGEAKAIVDDANIVTTNECVIPESYVDPTARES